ncbi:aminodeoxychorismate lyase [Salmonella enterica subsp. indica]|uniref:Aminodeoxychorismate lyase n=3 Tax=Salmonella enterica TaxID=28901 RepID=A0A5Y2QFP3_SALER|nr:aminodeoxychorismate lyase [Salmonella enterica]EAW1719240.1 aminodeoxychorismate lyase [Salmonella enterica subsp. indica]ECF4921299.1 aminodeoxychorismate lyase [Salmonella enterica subsp. arizonae]EEJ9033328.1 aminodeoxychorismate lyase [Salmonella enterica subsp. enterica serovar Oslo]EEM2502439.1 aminodeoxychorismate lyase [Salmonella enterica subsp. indica serovar 45:a:e,n,x]HAE8193547.1 aminodeoxychorismate lyase [Salmonella enterica subsp. indica serovar 41:b:1,7]
MYLINGSYHSFVLASDRSVQFGDGCFTTARITAGRVQFLTRHLQRLRDNTQRLGIIFPHWDSLADEMHRMATAQQDGVLKVAITRGTGSRGYSPTSCENPTRILSVSAYPSHYYRWKTEGVALTLSPVPLGRNPYLAGLKHLNRLEQVLIRSHLEQTDADEALVLDSEGWVTECCAANLFWRTGNIVSTPRLDQAGVNGIMRQFFLRRLAQSPFQVVEVQAREEAVRQADEVVICNALMPIIPVRAYDDVLYSSRTLFQFLAPFCEHPN